METLAEVTDKNFVACSRCGRAVALLGFEEHRKTCNPPYPTRQQVTGLSRINSMTDEMEFSCAHMVFERVNRGTFRKETVWHSGPEALKCIYRRYA